MRSIVFVVFVALGWARVSAHPSIVTGSDSFEFTYRVHVPTNHSGSLRLWMPLAKSDSFQTVEIDAQSAALSRLTEKKHANEILHLSSRREVGPIELRYRVRRVEKSAYPATEKDLSRYLAPERLVPTNQTFHEIATEVVRGRSKGLARGRALYDHVLARMKYDKSGSGWGRGDAVYACDAKTGNCTDFHAYFIALARSIGIPARFAIGFTIPAESNQGTIAGYHCWAEFYADGKWVPVDISEADKTPELADYYFGHHPANRFEFTTGRDLIVEPGPSSGPINFLVYPLAEIDGEVVTAKTEFTFRRLR